MTCITRSRTEKVCVTCGYFVGERAVTIGKTEVRHPIGGRGECCCGSGRRPVPNNGCACLHYKKWCVLK